jgi:alpha-glucuronidase
VASEVISGFGLFWGGMVLSLPFDVLYALAWWGRKNLFEKNSREHDKQLKGQFTDNVVSSLLALVSVT